MASEGTPADHTRDPGEGAKPGIPDDMVSKWQGIVDLLAEIVGVPAGLVMKVDPPQIEVFLASDTQGNPYRKGERAKLDTGLYCETVMRDRAQLLVPDARKDRDWDHNPDIELGMVSYLGLPVEWPDGEVFGTICVLDDEENAYSDTHKALLGRFKETLDHDLRWVLDSAERLRAEKALQESEERYRELAAASFEGVAITERGVILDVNEQFARMLGCEPSDAIGRSVADFVAPESRELVARTIKSGGDKPYEHLAIRHDGSVFPVEAHGRAMRYQGRQARVTAVRDITERKRAEETSRRLAERVQHGQKLESLGVLAGGVAHDFNNLLVGMLGHSSLALQKLPAASAARGNIGKVVECAERAADLARQMLAYSGHGHFVIQPMDLASLVRENLHLLEASIPKNVQLREALGDRPSVVEVDVGQIQQLLMNLVLNGAEAIGDRAGVVTIGVGRETLAAGESAYSRFVAAEPEPGDYVCLEVQDDGCGMDEKTIEKIFDPFFTTKFVGRGLGLAAVLGIVRGHRGGIEVRSEPGGGTRVKVVLPAAPELPARAGDSEGKAARIGTILLIDDEEVVRDTASEMLAEGGLVVLTAESGAAGVALYEERGAEIGVVLLDYSMPEMGGQETFKALRKLDPQLPIILSSGFGEEEATRRFEGLGLSGFIQKPYRPERLLAEIRRCIGQEPAAS